jgi:hypothetical protein
MSSADLPSHFNSIVIEFLNIKDLNRTIKDFRASVIIEYGRGNRLHPFNFV